MTFCGKCGAKNPDDADFCFRCGIRLIHAERADAATDETETFSKNETIRPESQAPKSSQRSSVDSHSGYKTGAIVLNIIALIATLFIVYMCYKAGFYSYSAYLLPTFVGVLCCLLSLHYVSKAGIFGCLLILFILFVTDVGNVFDYDEFIGYPPALMSFMIGPIFAYLVSDFLACEYERKSGKAVRVLDLNRILK